MLYVIATLLLILVLANETGRGLLAVLLALMGVLAIAGAVIIGLAWLWTSIKPSTPSPVHRSNNTDCAPTTPIWNRFSFTSKSGTVYYFDADSVMTNGDMVTLWLQYVKNTKQPDEDGSYSTAQKVYFSCSNRTVQVTNESTYDKTGLFIRANSKPYDIQKIEPDDILSYRTLMMVCASDFPRSKSMDQYYPVEGNNIYNDAVDYYNSLNQGQSQR